MKNYKLNDITVTQYIFYIHGAQVGVGILALPREVAEVSGTDGWISLMIGWFINCLAGVLIIVLLRKYPDFALPDLLNYLFGKWGGKIILLPIVAYFAFYGWLIMINAMLYLKAVFLLNTPAFLVVLLLCIPSYMLLRNGLRIQARFSELCFYIFSWMALFLLLPLEKGYSLHLLPVLKEGWGPVFAGVKKTIYSFSGPEILFVIYPFLKKKEYAISGFLIANTLTMFIYLFCVIVCFIFFSPEGITEFNQPVLSIFKNIEFRFLERFDMIFFAFYLFPVARSWTAFMNSALFMTSHLFERQDHRPFVIIYLFLSIICVFVFQPTWNLTNEWQKIIVKGSTAILFIFPLLLYLYDRSTRLFQGRKAI